MTYHTYMKKTAHYPEIALLTKGSLEPSTLVLAALAALNEDLRDNDAFLGYTDDHEGTTRLLTELWDVYYGAFHRAETPEELVCAWYEQTFEDCRIEF
jgi:hypothetical protein